MESKQYRVTGKVQGVFFRATTQEQALQLGINGWVKNESDGSVTVRAEGQQAALQQFESFLQKGPPRADVAQVSQQKVEPEHLKGFRIA